MFPLLARHHSWLHSGWEPGVLPLFYDADQLKEKMYIMYDTCKNNGISLVYKGIACGGGGGSGSVSPSNFQSARR